MTIELYLRQHPSKSSVGSSFSVLSRYQCMSNLDIRREWSAKRPQDTIKEEQEFDEVPGRSSLASFLASQSTIKRFEVHPA